MSCSSSDGLLGLLSPNLTNWKIFTQFTTCFGVILRHTCKPYFKLIIQQPINLKICLLRTHFMPAINFIPTLEMQKKKESHKIQRTELMRHQYAMQPWKQLCSEKKKNNYKTQFTINTPIIKMLKKRSNIKNNLSCKKHRTHILDLSFRRNNLKIGLSALSKKPPWLEEFLKSSPWLFQVLPDFSKY